MQLDVKLRHIYCITLTVLPLALCFPLCWLFVSSVWLTCDDGQPSYPNWPCNMQGYWSQLLKWVWSRRRWGRWLAEETVWRLGIEALMMAGKDHPEWDRIYHQIMYICQIFLCKCLFAKIVCIMQCVNITYYYYYSWILPVLLLHFPFLLNLESSDVSEIRDTVRKMAFGFH